MFSFDFVQSGSYQLPSVFLDGKCIAQFPFTKEAAARNFMRFCETNDIRSLEEWKTLPWKFQREFICCTSTDYPSFPHKRG